MTSPSLLLSAPKGSRNGQLDASSQRAQQQEVGSAFHYQAHELRYHEGQPSAISIGSGHGANTVSWATNTVCAATLYPSQDPCALQAVDVGSFQQQAASCDRHA